MFLVFVVLQEEVLGTLLKPCGMEVPEILQSARSTSSTRNKSAAVTSVFNREKPFVSLIFNCFVSLFNCFGIVPEFMNQFS